MITIKANSGILLDDTLDRLRGDALIECMGGLPEALVYYLRALEAAYLNKVQQEHKRSLTEIGWKFLPTPKDPA